LDRFVQPDTNIAGTGNIQEFNGFSYSNNNPIEYTDPSGYFTEEQFTDYLVVDPKNWGHHKDLLGSLLSRFRVSISKRQDSFYIAGCFFASLSQ
jgi:hypothetical protein